MLDALEAYNRSMLGLGPSTTSSSSSKAKGKGKATSDGDDSAAETHRFGLEMDGSEGMLSESENSDDNEESGEFYDEDEEFEGMETSENLEAEVIPTVVYADTAAHTNAKVSKADYKRFMVSLSHMWMKRSRSYVDELQSSKSAKILASDNPSLALDNRKRKAQEDGDEEEQ